MKTRTIKTEGRGIVHFDLQLHERYIEVDLPQGSVPLCMDTTLDGKVRVLLAADGRQPMRPQHFRWYLDGENFSERRLEFVGSVPFSAASKVIGPDGKPRVDHRILLLFMVPEDVVREMKESGKLLSRDDGANAPGSRLVQ